MNAPPAIGTTVRFMGRPGTVLASRDPWRSAVSRFEESFSGSDPARVRVRFSHRRIAWVRVDELDPEKARQ